MRANRNRKSRGAMTAEYIATLYMFLLFIVFPLLNLGTICLRSFFLWFACNQAVMAGCKAVNWETPCTRGTTYCPPASGPAPLGLAETAANRIKTAFPGINFLSRPKVEIILEPINGGAFIASQTKLAAPPDTNVYLPLIRVTIDGTVDPLIPMKLGTLSVVGLTSPMPLTVRGEAIFENPANLDK